MARWCDVLTRTQGQITSKHEHDYNTPCRTSWGTLRCRSAAWKVRRPQKPAQPLPAGTSCPGTSAQMGPAGVAGTTLWYRSLSGLCLNLYSWWRRRASRYRAVVGISSSGSSRLNFASGQLFPLGRFLLLLAPQFLRLELGADPTRDIEG